MIYHETPTSSTVLRVGYDEETHVLRVDFASGSYEYTNVPPIIFSDLTEAPSVGSYIAQNVKGKYNYRKV